MVGKRGSQLLNLWGKLPFQPQSSSAASKPDIDNALVPIDRYDTNSERHHGEDVSAHRKRNNSPSHSLVGLAGSLHDRQVQLPEWRTIKGEPKPEMQGHRYWERHERTIEDSLDDGLPEKVVPKVPLEASSNQAPRSASGRGSRTSSANDTTETPVHASVDANPCSLCQTIDGHSLSTVGFEHHSFAQLLISASDGCKLCMLFRDAILDRLGASQNQSGDDHWKSQFIRNALREDQEGTTLDPTQTKFHTPLVLTSDTRGFVPFDPLLVKVGAKEFRHLAQTAENSIILGVTFLTKTTFVDPKVWNKALAIEQEFENERSQRERQLGNKKIGNDEIELARRENRLDRIEEKQKRIEEEQSDFKLWESRMRSLIRTEIAALELNVKRKIHVWNTGRLRIDGFGLSTVVGFYVGNAGRGFKMHSPAHRLALRADTEKHFLQIKDRLIESFDAVHGPEMWIRGSWSYLSPSSTPVTYLPRRVLDLQPFMRGANFIRLVDVPNPTACRYVCLSHCWSESEPLTTTSATINDRLNRIQMSHLSLTLQDTVKLTAYLNVRYLWIDSLCIIQDSGPDWDEESAKMSTYYGDSAVTIMAGRDKSKGLFGDRESGYPYVELKTDNGFGPQNLYFRRRPHEPVRHQANTSDKPAKIFSRGWTLQEDLLSPRVISFEETQTYFRTNYAEFYECGAIKLADKIYEESNDRWLSIVENYSRRQLTHEDDKLPALSGLAADYQRRWNDHYLAGIWQRQLWRQLQWYVVPDSTYVPRRPSAYRAPSWSWASVDGHIAFQYIEDKNESLFEVSQISATPSGVDLRGRVSSGFLTFYGHIEPYSISSNADTHHYQIDSADDLTVLPDVDFENDELRFSHQIFYLSTTFGLILRNVERPGLGNHFVRIAAVQVRSSEYRIKSLSRKHFQIF